MLMRNNASKLNFSGTVCSGYTGRVISTNDEKEERKG